MSKRKKKKNKFLHIVKKTIVTAITPFIPFIIFAFAIIFILSTVIDFFAGLFNSYGMSEYDQERLKKYMREDLYISEEQVDTEYQSISEIAQDFSVDYNNDNPSINDENSPVSKDMFIWPIPGYTTITSHYGMRVHPITRSLQTSYWNRCRCSNGS